MTPKRVPIVLCVDDERPVLSSLSRLLSDEPYRVVTVQDPASAIEWVRDGGVEVVVTDQRMPAMQGTDLLRDVATIQPDIRTLVLTAHPDRELEAMVRRRQIGGLVTKPWDDEDLKRRIRALL